MKTALVTGGAGFIGSHVADAFLAAGYRVVCFDDLSSGVRANVPAAASFVHGDVREAEAHSLIRDGEFDIVLHLAAQMDVRRSVADPAFDADVNVRGSLNILEAVRQSRRKTRVVFASTGGAIYGDAAAPPTLETAVTNPDSPYGIAKLAVEYYMSYYARIHDLDVVALRYANVYGPRQNPHGEAGVVAIFCERLLAGKPLTVFGDGLQTRDYISVEDVARANVLAATADLPKSRLVADRAYNIGTGVQTSVLTLATILGDIAGASAGVRHEAARPGEQRRSAIDPSKAAGALHWHAAVELRHGLASTYASFGAAYGSRAGAT
ncbi:MAG: UDP-glucose 4-epimerase [Gemmatimonadaceae bacterium]